jgi:sulfonate dioxygenase
MAPALVETASQLGATFDPAFRQVSGVGQYKEAYIGGPKAFKKEVEEKGSETQPPATYPNYLPVWDREKRESTTSSIALCQKLKSV